LIPHSRPTLGAAEASRVAGVVAGGHVAQGAEVAVFEAALAERFGTPAAAAVSSGTAALELALRALDVAPGDEIMIPTFVCDALWHAVTRVGATPVLADADPSTLSLCADDARRRRTPRTRGVIVPHAFGRPVPLDAFLALDLPVIEDCAQTLSPSSTRPPVGSRGAAAVGSFYATKLLTTGEGGAVAGTERVVMRARAARDYDRQWTLAPRFNYKLTDVAAALGRVQLDRVDGFLVRRRAIAARYRAALAGGPCRLPADTPDHVYHRFVVGLDRPVDPVIARLEARGVAARRPVFRPLHVALGLDGYPEADRLWAESLSLPCYPSLADADVDAVVAALVEALAA
jgi:dTDP-4-amino-4,6-dideoxygalactose transaminase